MTALAPDDYTSAAHEHRAGQLADARLDEFARRCDQTFALLIFFQFVVAVGYTFTRSFYTWDGLRSAVHPHVYAAIFLGGLISALPLALAWRLPGRPVTRQVIAVAQMAWGGLLIHLTGGRIETHFHVFVSLAFLAWYRDWRVIITATIVTALDHAARGRFAPASVYGITYATPWQTIEHTLWVLFEAGFLIFAMRRSLLELSENCRMQAALERGYERIAEEVRVRTADLAKAESRALANEAFLARVGDIAGVGGWQLDLATQKLSWTPSTVRLHDCPPDYLPDVVTAIDFYAPDAQKTISDAVFKAIRDGTAYDLELPMVTAKGRKIFVRTIGNAEFHGNTAVRLVGAIQDITERRKADLEIRKLSLVVEQTPASVVITDTSGAIEYVNPAFVQSTGYTAGEMMGKNCRILKSGLMPSETYAQMWRDLNAGREWRGELQNRRKDGELYWVLTVISPLKDASGRTTQFMAVKENITARKAMEDELRTAARTDKLTGLPNRASLAERLQQAVARKRATPSYHFALLFLDFDRFKSINDSLGHDTGDLLLKEIAKRLNQNVGGDDTQTRDPRPHLCARLGGDEFVVLFDALTGPAEAKKLGDRLLAAFTKSYRLGEHEVFSTASIGIVTDDVLSGDADDLLRDADTAMYEAKLAGKGQYVLFDVSMRQRVQRRADLENDLRHAVDCGGLFLMYQPVVSLKTGEIDRFEALVRWRHPERGVVMPGEFVPIAEDTGLVVPIGEWVLREACGQLAKWRRELGVAAPRGISVNLSRKQLILPGVVGMVRQTLEQSGIPANTLHLEVTESAVMGDVDTAIKTMHALKNLGVKLDMDDFGTGYSSLACLRQFPIDTLKIDRSFITHIDRGRDFAALVNAVAQLARNLDISIVAEGVETIDQVLALQALDCDFGQGYHFSRPLTADAVPGLVLTLTLPGIAA